MKNYGILHIHMIIPQWCFKVKYINPKEVNKQTWKIRTEKPL
jgi:hypothetical protein